MSFTPYVGSWAARRTVLDANSELTRLLDSQLLVASGLLQFLHWHLVFDPHASSAGSGRMPCWPSASCCGPRRQNTMGASSGNDLSASGPTYEMGRESSRRSTRSRRRRMADIEAFRSGSEDGRPRPHGLAARSEAARYKSLGRRDSRSSRHYSDDSLDALP